jgi:hypothetical protein
MNNRAETPEQKRDVIERIYAVWLLRPTERLGQMLVNCLPERCADDPFYIEDFELCEALEKRI